MFYLHACSSLTWTEAYLGHYSVSRSAVSHLSMSTTDLLFLPFLLFLLCCVKPFSFGWDNQSACEKKNVYPIFKSIAINLWKHPSLMCYCGATFTLSLKQSNSVQSHHSTFIFLCDDPRVVQGVLLPRLAKIFNGLSINFFQWSKNFW